MLRLPPGDFDGGDQERLLDRDDEEWESQASSGRLVDLIPLSMLKQRLELTLKFYIF